MYTENISVTVYMTRLQFYFVKTTMDEEISNL